MSANTSTSKEIEKESLPQSQSQSQIFEHNGNWAYKSPIDGSLFIFNQESNEWQPEAIFNELKNGQNNNKKKEKKPNNNKRSKTETQLDKEEKLLQELKVLYVTGLPENNQDKVTNDELYQFFRKSGYIEVDPSDNKPKIIQFINQETNTPRGDAIISYERKESIPLAILQLDETDIKKNYKIRVQKATLDQAQYFKENDSLVNKKSKKDRRKQSETEKKFGWSESESKSVIIKNLFTLEESEVDPNFFNDLQTDLEDTENGCGKCGEISSINIFERNPQGVASIKFKDFESAERCVALINGRFFGGKKLEAEFYDGYTDYSVKESEEQTEERLKRWEKWLENNGDKNNSNSDEL